MSVAVSQGREWPPPTEPAPGRPRPRRTRLWQEVLIIGWLLWLYDAVNNLSSLRLPTALAHGRSILHVERLLHLAVESPLNRWLGGHHLIAVLLSNFYDDAHFIVIVESRRCMASRLLHERWSIHLC